MSKRTAAGIIIAVLLGCVPAVVITSHLRQQSLQCSTRTVLHKYHVSMFTMGTVADFTLYATDEAAFRRALAAGKAEFDAVMKLANLYDRTSELSRLNQTAYHQEFFCSPEMWTLLMRAEKAAVESDYYFDITVKPLMELWGFYRKRQHLPSQNEINDALTKVGFRKLKFDRVRRSVSFTVPGMSLDMGGIAKGYAADRAAQAIVNCGIKCGVINLGGNIKLLPELPPGKKFYKIGIRNPEKPGELLPRILELPGNRAIATSGDYERFVILDGVRCGHIVNPHTGKAKANPAVTVTTISALDADIFSTSVYLGREKCIKKLKAIYPEIDFYLAPPHTDN